MKKKPIQLISKIFDGMTIFAMIFCLMINFESLSLYFSSYYYHSNGKKSLYYRFHNFFRDKYGLEKGMDICFRIRDFTVWLIENRINNIYFMVITIMMMVSFLFDMWISKRVNRRLLVYYIALYMLVLITIFVAAPDYIHGVYDK